MSILFDDAEGVSTGKYDVLKISYEQTKPFILDIHYAKRMPSISYAYGLFDKGELVGIVSYGSPVSPFFMQGYCWGKK